MKIRPRTAVLIGWTWTAVFLLVTVGLWGTKVDIIGKIAAVLALCGIVFWIVFGRCPKCGRVARPKDDHCRKCGAWLNRLPGEKDDEETQL